jgi:hypothetical protein
MRLRGGRLAPADGSGSVWRGPGEQVVDCDSSNARRVQRRERLRWRPRRQPLPDGGQFMGNHRLGAAIELRWQAIPVEIVDHTRRGRRSRRSGITTSTPSGTTRRWPSYATLRTASTSTHAGARPSRTCQPWRLPAAPFIQPVGTTEGRLDALRASAFVRRCLAAARLAASNTITSLKLVLSS